MWLDWPHFADKWSEGIREKSCAQICLDKISPADKYSRFVGEEKCEIGLG